MKKLVKALVPRLFSQGEFYLTVLVLALIVSIIPYEGISLICAIFNKITHEHAMLQEILYPMRKWSLVYIGIVVIMSRVKIFLVEWCNLTNKHVLWWWDSLATPLIWIAFGIFLMYTMTALAGLVVLNTWFTAWRYTILVNDMTIYVLSLAALYIFGVIVSKKGKLARGVKTILMTHFSFLDYFLWPYLLGIIISKIVFGKNLMKYWPLSVFFKIKGVDIERETKEGKIQGQEDIDAAREKGYAIAVGTPGRSYTDTPKDFGTSSVRDVAEGESVQLIIVVDSGRYRRPLKGAVSKKKNKKTIEKVDVKSWWNLTWILKAFMLPWQNKARIVHVVYSKAIMREKGEDQIKYCARLNRIKDEIHARELKRIDNKPQKAKLFTWLKWNYRILKRFFSRDYEIIEA